MVAEGMRATDEEAIQIGVALLQVLEYLGEVYRVIERGGDNGMLDQQPIRLAHHTSCPRCKALHLYLITYQHLSLRCR